MLYECLVHRDGFKKKIGMVLTRPAKNERTAHPNRNEEVVVIREETISRGFFHRGPCSEWALLLHRRAARAAPDLHCGCYRVFTGGPSPTGSLSGCDVHHPSRNTSAPPGRPLSTSTQHLFIGITRQLSGVRSTTAPLAEKSHRGSAHATEATASAVYGAAPAGSTVSADAPRHKTPRSTSTARSKIQMKILFAKDKVARAVAVAVRASLALIEAF